MWTKLENGDVQITMSQDDFTTLIFALGIASGASRDERDGTFYRFIRLVNRLNEGNPHFWPYEVAGPAERPLP